jgi:predicted O-methyltransferase YrrM
MYYSSWILVYFAAMEVSYTAKAWLRHLWQGRLNRSLHSPYLFALFRHCLGHTGTRMDFRDIERQRRWLLQRKDIIDRTDYGAGSVAADTRSQSIGLIARNALSRPGQCEFMARLAQFNHSKSILELGTSLGIMSAYLKKANNNASITTVEGDKAISRIAMEVWDRISLPHIDLRNDTFEQYFESKGFSQSSWDLVFIDGNHRSSALLDYFTIIKKHIHQRSIVVIDDIYWSRDMQEGWQQLKLHPEVTQSVDCFRFGLLFFTPDFLAKEHHRIILL